eukprot:c16707_g1_i1.p1 GENE.c16707_g1_i1~~c16707_g1_i1.p1  ORF type:complete len:272 (+),score=49.96 c16707_g1_i1:1396-2211(+)
MDLKDEIAMIACMFPNANELVGHGFDPHDSLEALPENVLITLTLPSGGRPIVLDLSISQDYPAEPPLYSVGCSDFSREFQAQLHEDLVQIVTKDFSGQPSLLAIVQHVQTMAELVTTRHQAQPTSTQPTSTQTTLAREYIWSHHLYSKTKRKFILDTARNNSLSGFSCPGKPGIIVVEGEELGVRDFSSRVKSLTWQRIRTRHYESESCKSLAELESTRKFEKFKELAFQNGSSTHLDRSALLEYMTAHKQQQEFYILLGMETNDEGDPEP